MDLIADNWKKYPLLLVGELSVSLPEAQLFPIAELGAPSSIKINNFYLLIAVADAELPSLLVKLEQYCLSPAQIILLLRPESDFSHVRQAFLGQLDIIDGESADEFRVRLLGKLEAQRQKMLCFAMQEAADSGFSRTLPELEFGFTLDSCRIAHALACSYALPPSAHERVLRACFEKELTLSPGWTGSLGVERLIVETSLLLIDSFRNGSSFREQLKEKTATLPFRARNDLLHHVESTLSYLLRGKSHVA